MAYNTIKVVAFSKSCYLKALNRNTSNIILCICWSSWLSHPRKN